MLFSSLYSQYVGLWKAAVIPGVCSQWIDIETLGALVLMDVASIYEKFPERTDPIDRYIQAI
jgi:hypothetical protein